MPPLQSLWKLEAQNVTLGRRWAILPLQGHLRPNLESHRLHPRYRARLPAQIGRIPDQAFCNRGQDPGHDGVVCSGLGIARALGCILWRGEGQDSRGGPK